MGAVIRRRRRAWDAERHLGRVKVSLDAAHEGADHLAPPLPVEPIQPGADPTGELAQPPDHQLQAAPCVLISVRIA